MRTFVDVLHVLSAVLLVGPLMTAPFLGRRAIQRRSPDGVRMAAGQTSLYGWGSVVTALLGLWLVSISDDRKLSDVWIVISMTLYVVALCIVFFYAVPALRRAARLVEQGVMVRPEPTSSTGSGEEPVETQVTSSATDLLLKEQLDKITGRVGLAGLLVLLVFAVITVLMTAYGH